MKIIILVIIAAILFSGLGLWLVAYGNTTSEETNMNYGISMTTDKVSYSFGEPVKMMFKVFNYTEENVHIIRRLFTQRNIKVSLAQVITKSQGFLLQKIDRCLEALLLK
jgi:CHASE1-domain containing sensor protein